MVFMQQVSPELLKHLQSVMQRPEGTVALTFHMQNAVAAKGVPSDRRFRIGADGTVAVIGDHGVSVEGVYYYVNGQAVIEPTALEAWNETVKALELLATGRSSAGHLYEVALANLTLSILATGFEAYTRKRFIELVHEGIAANEDELLKTLSESKRDTARTARTSVLQYVGETTNFMSYEKCKRAYNKAYGIRFGDLRLPEGRLASLKSFLHFRHKIVHVSPLLTCLNPEHCPPENPALPNARMAKEAIECFSGFIAALHAATLALRPGK